MTGRGNARWRPVTSATVLCTLLTTLAACNGRERSAVQDTAVTAARSPELAALHARCVEAMVRNACAATDRSTPAKPESSPVVMIAGVGAVDARFYVALRDAGDQMCGEIVQPCSDAWDGSACRTARALWPEAAATQGVATLASPTRR